MKPICTMHLCNKKSQDKRENIDNVISSLPYKPLKSGNFFRLLPDLAAQIKTNQMLKTYFLNFRLHRMGKFIKIMTFLLILYAFRIVQLVAGLVSTITK